MWNSLARRETVYPKCSRRSLFHAGTILKISWRSFHAFFCNVAKRQTNWHKKKQMKRQSEISNLPKFAGTLWVIADIIRMIKHMYSLIMISWLVFEFVMTSSNGNIFRVTGHFVRGIHWSLLNYINPGYGLSLVDTLWNASSYRQPLEQEGNPMT